MTTGILATGAYLPVRRLQRSEVVKAHQWFNPGLKGLGKGERAIANWDEDSVTMALEASRDCLQQNARDTIAGVCMASTSFPFVDRQNAGIVADALNLPSSLLTLDMASSQRAGTSALTTALQLASAHSGPILVAAAERRRAAAASPYELTLGDGAAALLVGSGDQVIAKLLATHTESVDFVDHYRGQDEAFDYGWEERWVRDEGYMKIVPVAVAATLAKAGLDGDAIDHFCFPSATARVASGVARACKLNPDSVADNLRDNCGETGTAHPLLMLVQVLEQASAGERILVTGFGQGCDALLFEVTDAIGSIKEPQRKGVAGHLQRRRAEDNYHRYLAHNDLITLERGIRAEVDRKTGLSTLYRNRDKAQRMIGGHCTECGTNQFPKSRICVNPECHATDTQRDEPFAEKLGRLNSFTADRLTYSPDPPAWYGMVQFEGGGRLMADFADIAADAELQVGMPMRMMFRVKDFDAKRGFRRYFWKAVPEEI
jgi:3-hydroxy-3-methylglutaryl CoA synthase